MTDDIEKQGNTIKSLINIIILFIVIILIFYGLFHLFSWGIDQFINLAFDDNLRHTRNMSYDLRGDPLIIPRTNMVWNNPTRIPIFNQGI